MSKKNTKNNNAIQFRSVMEQKWEDLEPLYNASAIALRTISLEIQKSILILLSHKLSHSDPEVQLLNKAFLKDLEELTSKLLAIQEQHKDKKGLVKTEDDLAIYLGTGQAYTVYTDMVTSVLFNTAIEVENKILELRDELAKTQTESQEINKSTESKEEINVN